MKKTGRERIRPDKVKLWKGNEKIGGGNEREGISGELWGRWWWRVFEPNPNLIGFMLSSLSIIMIMMIPILYAHSQLLWF